MIKHVPLMKVSPWQCIKFQKTLFKFFFNDTSTLVGHFMLSPKEMEKRDKRTDRREEREKRTSVCWIEVSE